MIDGQVEEDAIKVVDRDTLYDPYKDSPRHQIEFERNAEKVATLKLHFKGGA